MSSDDFKNKLFTIYDGILEKMPTEDQYQILHLGYSQFFNEDSDSDWCNDQTFGKPLITSQPKLTAKLRFDLNALTMLLNLRLWAQSSSVSFSATMISFQADSALKVIAFARRVTQIQISTKDLPGSTEFGIRRTPAPMTEMPWSAIAAAMKLALKPLHTSTPSLAPKVRTITRMKPLLGTATWLDTTPTQLPITV